MLQPECTLQNVGAYNNVVPTPQTGLPECTLQNVGAYN